MTTSTKPSPETGEKRLRLVSDDDGHEYIIPADRRAEFDAWRDSEAAMDGEELPWAERLSMRHNNYTFTDWQEDR